MTLAYLLLCILFLTILSTVVTKALELIATLVPLLLALFLVTSNNESLAIIGTSLIVSVNIVTSASIFLYSLYCWTACILRANKVGIS